MTVKNAHQSIWLVRHPPVLAGQGLCYGRTDWPVDDDVQRAALESVAAWLGAVGPGVRIWSSPLSRCQRLAASVRQAQSVRVLSLEVDARLQELDFAAWEGRAWNTIERGQIDAWAADPWHYRPGGGESAHDVLTRWRSFRQTVLDTTRVDSPTVDLVVTHAGIIRMALFDAGLIGETDLWLHAVPYAQPLQLK